MLLPLVFHVLFEIRTDTDMTVVMTFSTECDCCIVMLHCHFMRASSGPVDSVHIRDFSERSEQISRM